MTERRAPGPAGGDPGRPACRVLVLGANGPTGRLVVRQALDRGLQVRALTRNPDSFPLWDRRLAVIGGDATDRSTVDAAVASSDAVVSVIGTAFTWRPVEVYSASARLVVEAMHRHDRRRLVVVTSMGAPRDGHRGGALETALLRLMRHTLARTLYDDMLEMEGIVTASGLDWTIVRPPGLSDDAARGYAVADTRIDGPAMTRADLAGALIDQLDDTAWVHRTAAVATPGLRLEPISTIRREVLKR